MRAILHGIAAGLFLLFFFLMMLIAFPLCALLDAIDRVTGRDKEAREMEKMMEEAHE